MNLKFSGLIASFALVALSSCSSVYKTGQTPDDVYYSPGRPAAAGGKSNEEYVETNRKQQYQGRNNPYYDQYAYRDDRYLQMMVSSGRRPYYDDYYYMDPMMYNNWRFNSYMAWNSPWNSPWNTMFLWNSFYNPYTSFGYGYGYGGGYYGGVPVKPVVTTFTPPSRPVSAFTLGSYLNNQGTNNKTNYRPSRGYSSYYNNSNYSNSSGESRRSSYSGESQSRDNNYSERPSRSYTPSSSSGTSSGNRSSSGGGGGVSRPVRSGN